MPAAITSFVRIILTYNVFPIIQQHGSGGGSGGSGGDSVVIAKGAVDTANSAVANQHEAAGQASFQAKHQLAQNAAAAAATAQAALAGKKVRAIQHLSICNIRRYCTRIG